MEDKKLREEENNNNSSHYKLVIPLLMLLICISIGYSYLSTGLKLTGGLGIPKMSWDIHFEDLVEDSTNNVVAITPATIGESKTSIAFDLALVFPGDKYGFDVDVVNNGTIDAMLSGYTVTGISPSQNEIISYTFTYADGEELESKDLLRVGERESLHFDMLYLDRLFDEDQHMNVVITLDYVQADETAVARD